jgi:hypothetical protein
VVAGKATTDGDDEDNHCRQILHERLSCSGSHPEGRDER